MSDQIFWFATRSAGIVAWFAASASIMIGLLIPTRALGRQPTIPWLLDLHRFFGAMSVLFLVVHMATLWADTFVDFGLKELLLPFAAEVPGLSRWSLALGVVAAWLLFAIEGSSLIKDWLPARAWHTIHLTSFGVMLSGALHGLTAGSDTDNRYLVSATASVTMAVVILAIMRAWHSLGDRKRRYDEELHYQDDAARGAVGVQFEDDYYDDGYESDEIYGENPYDYGRGQQFESEIPVTSGARLLAVEDEPDGGAERDADPPAWLRPPPRRDPGRR